MITFLIALSDNLLLVYRDATDICILILYLATLLNSFISSNRVFLWNLEDFLYLVLCFL